MRLTTTSMPYQTPDSCIELLDPWRKACETKGSVDVDVEMILEVQMIKNLLKSLKICEVKHRNKKGPKLYKECDGVAEKVETSESENESYTKNDSSDDSEGEEPEQNKEDAEKRKVSAV